jgi:hypothetical protein
MGGGVSDRNFNADGFLLYTRSERDITNYTQWFRCGGVEGYSSDVVRDDPTRTGTRVLFGRILTTETVRYVRTALEHMRRDLNLDPPFIVALTLVGAKGAWLQLGSGFLDGVPIDRDRVLVSPVVIENPDADLDAELRPALDVLWQAAGHPGAPNRQS